MKTAERIEIVGDVIEITKGAVASRTFQPGTPEYITALNYIEAYAAHLRGLEGLVEVEAPGLGVV